MKRITEAALLAGSAAAAGLGAALVDFGKTGQISWTPLFFLVVFGSCLAGMWAVMRRWATGASPFLLPPAALLVALGLVEIYRIDSGQASFHLWWVVAGMVIATGVLVAFRWGVGRLVSIGYTLAISGLCLIVLPFLPRLLQGLPDRGTGLWLGVGQGEVRFLIQPFGLGLVLFAVGLAGILSRWALSSTFAFRTVDWWDVRAESWWVSWRHMVIMAAVWVVTLPLLWATGDITAWLVVFVLSAIVVYVTTGESHVVWAGLALGVGGAVLGLASPRVRETVEVWLDPFTAGESGAGLRESLMALGTGNLSGSGLGMGDPSFVPHATSDWILAALGEELGLAGTVAVISLHALVVATGMGVALGSRDLFCKVTSAALSAALGLMFLAGAGGLERLLPPTRMGLPFLAYGGFPLLAGWVAMGLLLIISHQEKGLL